MTLELHMFTTTPTRVGTSTPRFFETLLENASAEQRALFRAELAQASRVGQLPPELVEQIRIK